MVNQDKQRLSKVMAQAGVDSRRHCEEIIFAGRVKVNGKTALQPQTMVGPDDKITVDGKVLPSKERKIYYILNKPRGYVCSNEAGKDPRVIDIFEDTSCRLFTVGRLDKETTGLLIVTNDGHFGQQVIHPSSNIEKEYIAVVNKPLTKKSLDAIKKGTMVDGVFVKPRSVEVTGPTTLIIVVKEGKKHEVRLIVKAADLEVKKLKRTRIGQLKLGRLAEGTWRKMTEKEKQLIFEKEKRHRHEK